jgi:hypothetical protein
MMNSPIFKALKWYIIVCFIICGFYCIFLSQQYDSVRPVMPAVLCFGMAYIVSFSWREFRKKVLFHSVASVIAAAFVARFGWVYLYMLTGIDAIITMNGFMLWAILVLVACVPFMAYIFHKHGR